MSIRRPRLLAIRPGEGRLIALLAGLFATVEAGRGLGEVGADTLFLSRFGADALPYLFIVLGAVSLVVALGYGAGIGRLERRRFLVGLMVVLALVLLVERAALLTGAEAILPAIWISVYAVGAVLLTVTWTVAGTTLDVRQAKRLYPICTSAAILGGFAGTLAAGPLAGWLGTESLLLLYGALLAVAASLTAVTLARRPLGLRPPARQPSARRASLMAELRVGFDEVRRSPLLRLVAAAYLLFAVLLFSVSFPFLRAMGAAFESEAELATALGLLSAAVTGASFLLSIGVANRLYARIGLMGAALVLPGVYLLGFGLWMVAFSLTTAIVVRFAQQVTQRGISNAAWSALYNVLPGHRRAQVMAFMDGVPGQVGISLSGVLLLVGGALLTETQVFIMGAVAAALVLWVVMRVRARYGETLVATLRSGLAERVLGGGPDLAALGREPHVLPALREALTRSDVGARRLATDLLGRIGQPDDARLLVGCLGDGEAEVRSAVVRSIAALDSGVLREVGPALADDPSAEVCAELAVALSRSGDEALGRAILDRLLAVSAAHDRTLALDALARLGNHHCLLAGRAAYADPHPVVRAAAVRALGSVAEALPEARSLVAEALDDDDAGVRRAAAGALARIPETRPLLLDTLRTGSVRSQEAALSALEPVVDGEAESVRAWALEQVDRAEALRRAARGRLDAGPIEEFLAAVIEQRRRRIERRLLNALAALGAREATGPIRRALDAPDADVRAQAVEALETLGDRRVARAVVGLLEAEPAPSSSDGPDALAALRDDPDPWIRALALRALHERQPELPAPRRPDSHPIERLALHGLEQEPEAVMPDSARTLAAIDRMLFLRGVPLFADLDPDDLHRVATSADERLYAPGETLVREGDLGDEMIVIVEGDVRVVQGPEARLVRTYQAGEHIGELAVLREQPRIATVIAGENGVRGLAIGGEALMAILHERPQAALAMLATLADRLSSQ